MRFRTFLTAGIEVLHLGAQKAESNAWPAEHWQTEKGRWKLYTPAIDAHLSDSLLPMSFGSSIEGFVLLLEVADFASWSHSNFFAKADGYVSYRHKAKEVWSVGQLDWHEIKNLTPKRQLTAYAEALRIAVRNTTQAKRRPKSFDVEQFAQATADLLQQAKVSQLSRTTYLNSTSPRVRKLSSSNGR
ncbi:hypothetical protein GNX71_22120 [Variovorax sp. RKNM96]|uniref:hypothetical protein n=1 Tax=Variovorax sp. RKNM96 TaxID=2681552 RepID=UPI00197CE805|nr:hypothetical protein [Variovorax sp. RKNM96]QSI32129.1 hypothetical protein GNX71_22120 [Variovorax sp. RKNM96]